MSFKFFSGELFKNTLNYMSGEVLTKGIYFLSIPLFSFLLTPSQYGNVAIFVVFYPLLTTFFSLNLSGYIRQGILKKELEGKILGTLLIFQTTLCLFFFFCFLFFRMKISFLLGLDRNVTFILFLVSILNVYHQSYQFYLLGRNDSRKYAVYSFVSAVLNIGLSLLFILVLNIPNDISRILGISITFLILGIYAMFILCRKADFKFDEEILKKALSFSMPLILHAIAGMLLAQSDRFMIKQIIGDEAAGLYSYAYNAGMIMQVLVIATNNSWIPLFYKYLFEEKYNKIEIQIKKYVYLMFLISILLMIIINPVMLYITDPVYHAGVKIIPVIIFSGFVILLNNIYANYIFYEGKTYVISLNTLIVTIVNIGMNIIWLERWGYEVAAYTTLIAYVLLFVLNYLYVVRLSTSKKNIAKLSVFFKMTIKKKDKCCMGE